MEQLTLWLMNKYSLDRERAAALAERVAAGRSTSGVQEAYLTHAANASTQASRDIGSYARAAGDQSRGVPIGPADQGLIRQFTDAHRADMGRQADEELRRNQAFSRMPITVDGVPIDDYRQGARNEMSEYLRRLQGSYVASKKGF